ncbi:MAG: hypothetical protein QNK37_32055 [Acidobacteriota bacterium]|nr:hypothetical protein [Acidobacteriota bacterium]
MLRDPVSGNLALPTIGDPAVDALISQVNTLKGFSTSAPLRIPLDSKVVLDSVNVNTVLLVDLIDLELASGGAQVNPIRPLDLNVTTEIDIMDPDDAEDDVEYHVINGFPIQPLKPGRPHLAILTQGVIGEDSGLPVESDAVTTLLKGNAALTGDFAALETLRQLYDSTLWPAAEAVTGQSRIFIPMAYAFTTQPLFETLQALRARAQNENPVPEITTAAIGAAQVDGLYNLLGLGAIPHGSVGAVYSGSFEAPNYISNPLFGTFQGEGENVQEISRNTIKFICATPPGPGPHPAIIYQHGITSFKETVFILAEAAAISGNAIIAIDLVLHGERQIDGDGDGQIDPSGDNYINLASPLTSRDNTRQSVADLIMLTRMISSGQTDFDGSGIFNLLPDQTRFVGISLGGIVGGVFAAVEPNITTANLNVPGGRVPYLLQRSPSFGPQIDAGLAQFGLAPGNPLYDLYFMFVQTINDDADPLNYGVHFASGALSNDVPTNVLIQEAINDIVIPPSATQDLARAVALTQFDAINPVPDFPQAESGATGAVGSGYYQFDAGHGALFSPAEGPTELIQFQSFLYLTTAIFGAPLIVDPAAVELGAKKLPEGVPANWNLDLFHAPDWEVRPEAIRLPKP